MKLVQVWKPVICRVCRKVLPRKSNAWRVSQGHGPKYYCKKCKPKEY